MKHCNGTYYATVIEDVTTNEIVGAGTLVIERKFIRECAVASLNFRKCNFFATY